MKQDQVTDWYLEGIKEGRRGLQERGISVLTTEDRIANLRSTIKGYAFSSPVGQLLRGELDFWKNQLKKQTLRKLEK